MKVLQCLIIICLISFGTAVENRMVVPRGSLLGPISISRGRIPRPPPPPPTRRPTPTTTTFNPDEEEILEIDHFPLPPPIPPPVHTEIGSGAHNGILPPRPGNDHGYDYQGTKLPPPPPPTTPLPDDGLIYSISKQSEDGAYYFDFLVENSVFRQEQGFYKANPENESEPILVMSGAYGFTTPEGVKFRVEYVADENGFRAYDIPRN